MEKNKLDILNSVMSGLEKEYGKGVIRRLGDSSGIGVPLQSTGNILIDEALGGGVGIGRITEIYGPESSGKTTLALKIIAEVNKKGGTAAFIDAEHALDPTYAKKLGVKVEDLLISQPDYGEQALEVAIKLIESSELDIIVIDSVAALVPKVELDGEMADVQMGLQARMMSKALRKMAGIVSKTKTIVIFINQIRMKIGVMFASPETTSGGNALKFFASTRMDVRRVETLKSGEEKYANKTKVKIVKNKLAPPYKECEVLIRFGEGIDDTFTLVDIACREGIIDKSGAWFSFNGERIGQGKENVCLFLKANPEIYSTIDKLTREKLFSKKETTEFKTVIEEDIIEVQEKEEEVQENVEPKKRGRKAKNG